MAGATARAVWNNDRYPAALLNGVMLRVSAQILDKLAACRNFKGIFNAKYKNHPTLQEVAYMQLNDDCTYQPYVLGQLFYVLEQIQLSSVDYQINRSIKDSYFRAAGSTPKTAFNKIIPLSEYHMKKLMRNKHNTPLNCKTKRNICSLC